MNEPTDNSLTPSFVLASASPRRAQLLTEAKYDFTAVPPPLNEPAPAPGAMPSQVAESLAYFKARSVLESNDPDVPVLGADTVVALDGEIFGKPRDVDHAREILGRLAGTRHQVMTGVALLCPSGTRLIASATTHVRMRDVPAAALEEYIATGLWEGKAGAYGIQDDEDPFVESIEGSFSNVVGLPMELLQGMFAQLVMRYCSE